jgi:hypothetical protein
MNINYYFLGHFTGRIASILLIIYLILFVIKKASGSDSSIKFNFKLFFLIFGISILISFISIGMANNTNNSLRVEINPIQVNNFKKKFMNGAISKRTLKEIIMDDVSISIPLQWNYYYENSLDKGLVCILGVQNNVSQSFNGNNYYATFFLFKYNNEIDDVLKYQKYLEASEIDLKKNYSSLQKNIIIDNGTTYTIFSVKNKIDKNNSLDLTSSSVYFMKNKKLYTMVYTNSTQYYENYMDTFIKTFKSIK